MNPLLGLPLVFLVIIILLAFRRPLYQAIFAGLIATVLLYQISLSEILTHTVTAFTHWSSLSVILSLYLISYLQRMLEARRQIKLAQNDLDGIFHNRRINATIAPIFIGLIPSGAAMILSSDIIKDASDDYLDIKEQAFVSSWLRHVPESILPTYSGVLLMASLSGVSIPSFMLGMIVPAIILVILGYFPYLTKLPKDPGSPASKNRLKDALHLIQHLWTLFLILILILAFDLSVVPSVLIVIVLAAFVYRFKIPELLSMLRSALEPKLLLNTILVLLLKEFIAGTNTLQLLPEVLGVLPIPMYLIFALLFFFGAIISGSKGIIAMGTPMAFAALDGGMPLMVLLMCMCHAAMQFSPTHVCLSIAADYYHISLGTLIRKTLPRAVIFALLMIGYYHLLLLLV